MKLARIKPALGRIVLEEVPAAERTEAGLYIVNAREQHGNICKVIWVCDPYRAAGDDQDEDAPSGPMYKPGDYVLIGKYNGVDIELGRRKFISLRESDIIGTLHEGEDDGDA